MSEITKLAELKSYAGHRCIIEFSTPEDPHTVRRVVGQVLWVEPAWIMAVQPDGKEDAEIIAVRASSFRIRYATKPKWGGRR